MPWTERIHLYLSNVWGCLTYNGVGTLEFIPGNTDSRKYIEVLDNNLWPVVAKNFPGKDWIFQEDNGPIHTSRLTTSWKNENNIPCLTLPSQIPDINIIENVWRTIKIKLEKRINEVRNTEDIIRTVKDIWYGLPGHYIRSLYSSIPTRLRHVIVSKGHITKM